VPDLQATEERREAMSDKAVRIDPSGFKAYSDIDGTMRVEIVVTARACRAMSARQLADLERGGELVARAFEPDEPAVCEDPGARLVRR
jgi:hypothetical protein